MRSPLVGIRGNVILFLELFAALWGLCKLLQRRWNNCPLISSYHLCAGSRPALGLWLTDRSQADWQLLCHIQTWLLLNRGPRLFRVSIFPFCSMSACSAALCFSFVPASRRLPCHHFPKSFAYLSWNLNVCAAWKIKCGAMRLMLSGWVKYHNIWHCQMHYVQDFSQVTPFPFEFKLSWSMDQKRDSDCTTVTSAVRTSDEWQHIRQLEKSQSVSKNGRNLEGP